MLYNARRLRDGDASTRDRWFSLHVLDSVRCFFWYRVSIAHRIHTKTAENVSQLIKKLVDGDRLRPDAAIIALRELLALDLDVYQDYVKRINYEGLYQNQETRRSRETQEAEGGPTDCAGQDAADRGRTGAGASHC